MRVSRFALALLLCAACVVPAIGATSLPDAVLILHVQEPGPGRAPEAAPLRFVLTKHRQVFVGGSRDILSAQLDKRDVKSIEKQLDRVRKLKGLADEVRIGPGDDRYTLSIFKGNAWRVVAVGDPAQATGNLRPIGQLLTSIRAFYNPAFHKLTPTQLLLTTRPGTLLGGCRVWSGLPVTLAESLPGPLVVPADRVHDWPTGAFPASVCADGSHYVVTLRPLLPGEVP